jgi:predicted nuclease with TOPRIM domain
MSTPQRPADSEALIAELEKVIPRAGLCGFDSLDEALDLLRRSLALAKKYTVEQSEHDRVINERDYYKKLYEENCKHS